MHERKDSMIEAFNRLLNNSRYGAITYDRMIMPSHRLAVACTKKYLNKQKYLRRYKFKSLHS